MASTTAPASTAKPASCPPIRRESSGTVAAASATRMVLCGFLVGGSPMGSVLGVVVGPTVGPTTTPSTEPIGLPPAKKPHKTIRVADAAATVPLDSRLIGGQLAGLAVLVGAVVLAIARLSLRAPKPASAEDKADSKPPAV